MRFKGLDLNLLVAFDALIDTHSITRSAEILNMSEPAVSAALTRLRDYFQDQLLVRDGRRFHPTAMALTLLPAVRQCLRDADALVSAIRGFDPSTSKRVFRIIASDYVMMAALSPLSKKIFEEAPGVGLDIVPPARDSSTPFEDVSVDLVICPEPWASPLHPAEILYEDSYVFAGWQENPVFSAPLTPEVITGAGHVILNFGASEVLSYGDEQLAALGVERRIEIINSSFSCAPWFLPGTHRLLLMHERLARFFSQVAPITYAQPPYPLRPLRMLLQFHRARRDDPGLKWLCERIRGLFAEEHHAGGGVA